MLSLAISDDYTTNPARRREFPHNPQDMGKNFQHVFRYYHISTSTLKNPLASFVGECHALSVRFVLP